MRSKHSCDSFSDVKHGLLPRVIRPATITGTDAALPRPSRAIITSIPIVMQRSILTFSRLAGEPIRQSLNDHIDRREVSRFWMCCEKLHRDIHHPFTRTFQRDAYRGGIVNGIADALAAVNALNVAAACPILITAHWHTAQRVKRIAGLKRTNLGAYAAAGRYQGGGNGLARAV